jgi:ABC-type nitrate/sulfonate/bicarbonate transport system ATPase subunit
MRLEVSIRSKTFVGASGSSRQALREIAFVLDKGRVGAIVGPSGCGKTTLLRIVAGLDRSFDGAVARPDAGGLAFVFQEPRLLPWRSVEDNIRLAAPDIDEADLAALLATFDIAGHRRDYPGALSLGLARRAALARALAIRPDLLLLDEPFASLDAATAQGLVDELTELVEARPVTTLLVTHDVGAAIRLADAIFVLSPGPARLLAQIAIPEPRRRLTAAAMTEIAARIDALR